MRITSMGARRNGCESHANWQGANKEHGGKCVRGAGSRKVRGANGASLWDRSAAASTDAPSWSTDAAERSRRAGQPHGARGSAARSSAHAQSTHPREGHTAVAAARALGRLLHVVSGHPPTRRLHHLDGIGLGVVRVTPRVRDAKALHHCGGKRKVQIARFSCRGRLQVW